MKPLLITLAVLSLGLTLNTYNIEVYNPVFNPLSSSNLFTYELGPVGSPGNVHVHINITNPSSKGPNFLALAMLNSTGLLVDPQPPQIFNTTFPIPQAAPSMVDVSFTLSPASSYYLYVISGNTFQTFKVIEITITVDGEAKNIASMLFPIVFKPVLIYFEEDSQVSLKYSGSTVAISFTIFPNTTFDFNLSSVVVQRKKTNFTKGYHLLAFAATNDTVFNASFQSDPYPCPYSPQFNDISQLYLPCLDYGKSVDTLVNTHQLQALLAHQCNPRQYYQGSCYNIDEACNTFNPRANYCYSCKDKSDPVDGKCTSALPPTTPSVLLPDNCLTVDSAGECTSCTELIYQVSKGACILKTCPFGESLDSRTGDCMTSCSSSQQRMNNICYNKPPNCLRLAPHLACQECETGYKFQRGDCVLARNLQTQP